MICCCLQKRKKRKREGEAGKVTSALLGPGGESSLAKLHGLVCCERWCFSTNCDDVLCVRLTQCRAMEEGGGGSGKEWW